MKKSGKNMDRIYDFRIGFYSLTAEEKEHRLWMLGRDPEICRLALATADQPEERARVAAEGKPSPGAAERPGSGAADAGTDPADLHGWGAAFTRAGYPQDGEPADTEPKPGAEATPGAAAVNNHGWDQAFAAYGNPATKQENR